jgi:hypothetical protein
VLEPDPKGETNLTPGKLEEDLRCLKNHTLLEGLEGQTNSASDELLVVLISVENLNLEKEEVMRWENSSTEKLE